MPRRTSAHHVPARPSQADRHHYVFLNRDGKPVGLVEAGWTGVNSEDDAWSQMYDTIAAHRTQPARHATGEQSQYSAPTQVIGAVR